MTDPGAAPLRAAVFASGSGTTFQALYDHTQRPGCRWQVVQLVVDRTEIASIGRAEAVGIPVRHIPVRNRAIEEVADETLSALEEARVDLVLLAGYLRLIPEAVVERFAGRILNTHPALLPSFGGKGMYGRHVHTAVVASGARISGPTVHLVDAEYDRGLPLCQWPVPVHVDDDAKTLAARVQQAERTLYPRVVDHLAAAVQAGQAVQPLPFEGSAFVLNPEPTTAP